MKYYKKYLSDINESIYSNLDNLFSILIYESAEYEKVFKIDGKIVDNIFTEKESEIIRKQIEKDLKEASLPVNKAPLLTRWLTREATKKNEGKFRYVYNGSVVEDASMLIADLILFLRYSKNTTTRDLNQIDSKMMNEIVKEYRYKADEKELIKTIKTGEAKKFDIGKFTVVEVHSHRAIQLYGSGTRWCLTMETPKYWNSYTREGEYPAYVIIPKSNQDNKYCFIFEANEFRDSSDEMVNPMEIAIGDQNLIKWVISKTKQDHFTIKR